MSDVSSISLLQLPDALVTTPFRPPHWRQERVVTQYRRPSVASAQKTAARGFQSSVVAALSEWAHTVAA